ncbi:MAG: FAS1 domain-containing protein [Monoraphidium minutum]|nr:MAG: FAS1 domain-containing protein [Monoraphidium minutum]
MRLSIALCLLAVAGHAAAQVAPAALAPQSTSATGAKYWKTPLVAALANNLTAFATNVEGADLGGALGVSNLTATIFAPSDAAFEALKASTDPAVQAILGDKEKLQAVLKYHVIPGATIGSTRLAKMIGDAKGGVLGFKSLQGDKVNATIEDGKVYVNGVEVISTDVQGGKTMVHTISDVIIPPSLLAEADAPATAGGDVPVTTTGGSAPASSAAAAAAGLLLAVPAALAALL